MIIPENATVVRTETSEYWLVEGEDVLYANIIPNSVLELEHVKANLAKRSELLNLERPIPTILDIRKIERISKEARSFSSKSTDGLSAIALLVDSGLSRVIGNYALMLHRPKIPTKLFTSEEAALEWINQYQP